jgi:hypothetical protein
MSANTASDVANDADDVADVALASPLLLEPARHTRVELPQTNADQMRTAE